MFGWLKRLFHKEDLIPLPDPVVQEREAIKSALRKAFDSADQWTVVGSYRDSNMIRHEPTKIVVFYRPMAIDRFWFHVTEPATVHFDIDTTNELGCACRNMLVRKLAAALDGAGA